MAHHRGARESAGAPSGARRSAMSRSPRVRRSCHLAGQVALDQQFRLVGGDDLGEQTKAAMRNVEVALQGCRGASWDDIVRRTIYTAAPDRVRDDHGRHRRGRRAAPTYPAQTIVGITGLAVPGLLIEIECTAIAWRMD